MFKTKKYFSFSLIFCAFFAGFFFFAIKNVQAADPDAEIIIDSFSVNYIKNTDEGKDAVVDGKNVLLSWSAHTEPVVPNPLLCRVYFNKTNFIIIDIFTNLVTSGTSSASNLSTTIDPFFIDIPWWPWGGHPDPSENYSLWLVCSFQSNLFQFPVPEYDSEELKVTVVKNEASYVDTGVCCGTTKGTCDSGIPWTVTGSGSSWNWACSDISEINYNKLPRDDKKPPKHIVIYCSTSGCTDECASSTNNTCEGNSIVSCSDTDADTCNEKTLTDCGSQTCMVGGTCCTSNSSCTAENVCAGSTCDDGCGNTINGTKNCFNAGNWREVAP